MKITFKNISFLLLFVLSFTWFYGWGNSIFFFQENNALFIWSADYLSNFTDCPGELLTWAGYFFTQGYFSPLYGSLLLSSLIALSAIVTYSVINSLEINNPMKIGLSVLPATIILLLQAQHEYYLYDTLGYLISMCALLLIIKTERNSRIVAYMFLFPLLYYIAGPYSLIFLAALTVWYLLYDKGKRYILTAVCLAYFVVIFIAFRELIFFQPDKKLLGYPLIFSENRSISSFKIQFALLLGLYPAVIKLSGLIRDKSGILKYAGIILLPLSAAALLFQYDPSVSGVLKLEKLVHEQDWNSVIKEYECSSQHNIVNQYFYDLALAETGQLCNRMFFGDQSSGPLALSLDGNRNQSSRTIYFYYCTGMINEAHHLAYETMVRHGFTPGNLKMLIKTELLRGNYRVAGNYLDKLRKSLHYRAWTKKYIGMTLDTSLIRKDPELSSKLRLMPAEDFFIGSGDSRNIEALLRSNPQNLVAREYKLAWSLLEKDIIEVSTEALKLKELGYRSIPRHVGEAIVAYRNISDEAPSGAILEIDPETEKRFLIYRKTLEQYRGDKEKLGKTGMNTFWYYMQFGKIKSDFMKSIPSEKHIN